MAVLATGGDRPAPGRPKQSGGRRKSGFFGLREEPSAARRGKKPDAAVAGKRSGRQPEPLVDNRPSKEDAYRQARRRQTDAIATTRHRISRRIAGAAPHDLLIVNGRNDLVKTGASSGVVDSREPSTGLAARKAGWRLHEACASEQSDRSDEAREDSMNDRCETLGPPPV